MIGKKMQETKEENKSKYKKGEIVLISNNFFNTLISISSTDFKFYNKNKLALILQTGEETKGKYLFKSQKYKVHIFDLNEDYDLFEEFIFPLSEKEQKLYQEKIKSLPIHNKS